MVRGIFPLTKPLVQSVLYSLAEAFGLHPLSRTLLRG